MVLAGQMDVVDKIKAGEDLYCDFASKMFGRTITKADKKERLLGKIAMLSLQYGAGWRKFKEMVRQQSGEIIADTSAEQTVNLYRSVHHKVVDMWNRMQDVVLPEIAAGCPNLLAIDKNAWLICTGEGFGVHANPGVVYHNLRKVSRVDDYGLPQQDWVYDMGRETPKLYGGKIFENACQHVARQIVMWQTARINERYPVALSVHDEAVCVVKNEHLHDAMQYTEECLSLAPPWCRGDIPLACETGFGVTYGSAK
jgi:DNA polymerase